MRFDVRHPFAVRMDDHAGETFQRSGNRSADGEGRPSPGSIGVGSRQGRSGSRRELLAHGRRRAHRLQTSDGHRRPGRRTAGRGRRGRRRRRGCGSSTLSQNERYPNCYNPANGISVTMGSFHADRACPSILRCGGWLAAVARQASRGKAPWRPALASSEEGRSASACVDGKNEQRQPPTPQKAADGKGRQQPVADDGRQESEKLRQGTPRTVPTARLKALRAFSDGGAVRRFNAGQGLPDHWLGREHSPYKRGKGVLAGLLGRVYHRGCQGIA